MFFQRLSTRINTPVDYASLAMMRIFVGLIVCWDIYRYFTKGWIARYYIHPAFHFTYYGFDWLSPWAGHGMYWHFAIMGVLSILVIFGLFYRFAIIALLLCFSYVFLLEAAHYLNHFYMLIIVLWLLAITPANKNWSLDAKFSPSKPHQSIPLWSIWIFRIQLEIIYLYAGIVKINPDWLQGEPLTMWLTQSHYPPMIQQFFSLPYIPLIGAYMVVCLHLIGPLLLLWRRTRLTVFIIYSVFHITNAWLFHIGIFPWMTIAMTLMFFDPDWPRQVSHYIKNLWRKLPPYASVAPVHCGKIRPATCRDWLLISGLALWFLAQILLPLRYLAYPGNVDWTEQGHRFAWRMMLREKLTSRCQFTVIDYPRHQVWQLQPSAFLSYLQVRTMCYTPDMILQFSHYLAKLARDNGYDNVAVYAHVLVSLNGRGASPLIDNNIDLTTIDRKLWPPATWILPLTTPLQKPKRLDQRVIYAI